MKASVICKGCGSSFEREKNRGRPPVRCSVCRNTILQFVNARGIENHVELIDGVVWIEASAPCDSCNKNFMRPRKRGRAPKKCPDCTAWDDAEKVSLNSTSQEVLDELFKGDKEMLLGTLKALPKGSEAQCPVGSSNGRPYGCGRIFTSDSCCESHKSYLPAGGFICKAPETLGMEPRERRGLPIWTRPTLKEN